MLPPPAPIVFTSTICMRKRKVRHARLVRDDRHARADQRDVAACAAHIERDDVVLAGLRRDVLAADHAGRKTGQQQ